MTGVRRSLLYLFTLLTSLAGSQLTGGISIRNCEDITTLEATTSEATVEATTDLLTLVWGRWVEKLGGGTNLSEEEIDQMMRSLLNQTLEELFGGRTGEDVDSQLGLITSSLNQSLDGVFEEVTRRRKNYATQIGTYDGNTADRALDGDINPDNNAGHCAQPHDASGRNAAWWMVDLGSEYAISNATIYSDDYDDDALGYISVRVSNSADISEHTNSDQCALWDNGRFPKASHQTLVCDQVMYGRYVSIQRTGGQRTHNMVLCEVMVMGREINTQCQNCNDPDCDTKSTCNSCKTGFKTKECVAICKPGYYGDQCVKCSDGCANTCARSSGTCSCKESWYGSKCQTGGKGISSDRPIVITESITDVSATIRWEKIPNVTASLGDFYHYAIGFYNETFSCWAIWTTTHSHETSPSQYQEATLTDLTYDTDYYVRVNSYIRVDGQTYETGVTDSTKFTTQCAAPEKPQNVNIWSEDIGNTIYLTITWKPPDTVGCNLIVAYKIMYHIITETEWTVGDRLTNSSTSHTLELVKGDYVVRVVVYNDGRSSGNSNYAEVTHISKLESGGGGGAVPIWAIGMIISIVIALGLLIAVVLLVRRVKQLKMNQTTEVNTIKGHKEAVYDEIDQPVGSEEPTAIQEINPDVRVDGMPEHHYEKPAVHHYVNDRTPEYEELRTS